jgi:hypothetical protein
MKFPLYWAKEETEARKPPGETETETKTVPVAVWRWSTSSLDDARAQAREAAAALRRRIEAGEPFPKSTYYGTRPAREETLRQIEGRSGEVIAAITRNPYGALVLNAAHAMFVDSDTPASAPFARIAKLFRRKQPEDPAVVRAQALIATDPTANIRVYRTRAGIRYLFTHALFDPVSERARDLMRQLAADPKYVQLCRVQESFRVRLTPKPWRCDLAAPPVRWPWQDSAAEAAMRAWLATYEQACAGKAVCSLLATIGSGHIHPEIEPLLRLHDDHTGVASQKPLA